jgi:fructosamine-3-kinase
MRDWPALAASLESAGIDVGSDAPLPVAGGDIAAAYRFSGNDSNLFLKLMPASAADVLVAEADGLAALAAAGAVRTPQVLGLGDGDAGAWLALEWLDMEPLDTTSGAELGRRLAELHRSTGARHGWHRDNWIGRTPQPNVAASSWTAFFIEHRLGHQLELARANGFGGRLQNEGQALKQQVPVFFETYDPEPSLLHGDLWGGNAAAVDGAPVIFDPAVHYGDRESDIAMTRLFGGFGSSFYEAYDEAWPLDAGYRRREPLYQLYHVLNHLNLFGGAYLGRAESLIAGLLRSI